MFDFKSPITQIVGEMQMEFENHVLKAVQNVGIHVNREELVKALAYDRGQYEKGYADGLKADKWIPCSERLPEEHESIFAKYKGTRKWDEDGMFEKISSEVYATVENMKTGESTTTHAHTTDGKWSCDLLRWSDTYRIIAWQPLPAPYQKGE